MEVHALFADGSASPIRIELDASSDPKVFLLGQPSRQLAISAERSVSAAYLALRRSGRVTGQYATFCELGTDAGGSSAVLGESAGLAFALGFAAAVLTLEHPKARLPALAATGVVTGGTVDATVGRVDGVEAKLAAAVTLLPPGGLAFFPAANAAEIPEHVRAAASQKRVDLIAVETVREALARLEATAFAAVPATRRRRAALATFGVTVAVVLGLVQIWRLERARGVYVEQAVRVGEFGTIPQSWVPLAWLDGATRAIQADATRDLTVVVSLRSLGADTQPTPAASGALVLGPEDRYRIEIEPSRDCYLYAIQIDSSGGGTVLFPNRTISADANPLHGSRRYTLPGGERWLRLDERPGKETVIVVAAPWPADDIERIIAVIPGDAVHEQASEPFGALWQRAALRRASRLERGLRGLVYEEISFGHR